MGKMHITTRTVPIALVTALLIVTATWASSGVGRTPALSVLDTLEGSWSGAGEILGREATFTMTWSRVLNGQFLRLDFANAYTVPEQPVLQAVAYYLPGNSVLTGQWMDTRGIFLSLTASLTEDALITDWTGEETGRTEYRVLDEDTLKVVDWVRGADGQYHEFGIARYNRIR